MPDADPRDDSVTRARSAAELVDGIPGLEEVAGLLRELADTIEAERRRVVRIGFDLHDGPLQDIAALGTDIHLFRDQLRTAVDDLDQWKVVGRVDDLLARLTAVDAQLRSMATSAESTSLLGAPLTATLARAVAAYTREGLEIAVSVDENLDESAMTDSQRIALIRIIQGALANVVLHSGAVNASVTVRQELDRIEAEVVDDGEGFLVQPTLRRAAETGRLGLVGMRERARLLGGRLSVESDSGGPTRVLLELPRWSRPEADDPATAAHETGQTGGAPSHASP